MLRFKLQRLFWDVLKMVKNISEKFKVSMETYHDNNCSILR